ncbi:MAG: HIT family protein [Bacillota bacterium]
MHKKDCIFCNIIKGEIDSYKVYENDKVYAFFDTNPINEYHTLIIPKKHYKDIYDIPEDELEAVIKATKKIAGLYKEKLGVNNVQIFSNSGVKAQQDVFHFHMHLVPREDNDGQDINWSTKPELREEFDDLLKKLNK